MSRLARAACRAPGRVPALVWLATLAFGGLLATYSVLVPLYEAPDEPGHVDLVMHAAIDGDYPAYNVRHWSAAVLADCATYDATRRRCAGPDGLETGLRPHLAADAPSDSERLTFEELGGDVRGGPGNQLTQHPPGYYQALALVVRAERGLTGESWSLAREVALLRLVNVVLVAPLPLLAWWAARRIGASPAVGVVASFTPLLVPQLAHIGSTVNNDNPLILAGALVAALVAGVVRGDRRWRVALALGALCGLALLDKASAFVLPPTVAVAYAVSWWRSAEEQRRAALGAAAARVAVVAVLTAAVSAWWYIRNRLRYSTFTPSIDDDHLTEALQPPGFSPSPRIWLDKFFGNVPSRFWGWFGWFSIRQTYDLILASSLLAGSLVAVGLLPRRRQSWRRATPAEGSPGPSWPRPGDLAVLLLPGLGLLGLVVGRGWRIYSTSSHLAFLQGRYLFPGVVGGGVVAAVGISRLARRWAAPAIAGWAMVMHVDALRAILDGYWGIGGVDLRGQVQAAGAWSPWPPWLLTTGLLMSLAASTTWAVITADESWRPGAWSRRLAEDAPEPLYLGG